MLDSTERVQMPVSPHKISDLSIKWKEHLPCKTIVGIKYLACTWCSTNKPIGFIPGIKTSGLPTHTENRTPRGWNERHLFVLEKSKRLLMECGVLPGKAHLIGAVMGDSKARGCREWQGLGEERNGKKEDT